MQDYCSPPSSLVHRFITPPYISTAVDQGRGRHLTCCVTTTLPLPRPVADLHYGWFGSKEGLGPAQIALRSGQWEKNAARSARAPLKNGAALHGERVQNNY
jgi:hypothetical protein